MEEPEPQKPEGLLHDLGGESGAEESPPKEVEELLRVLQSGSLYLARQDAAEQLGRVATSSPRIIRALRAAQESDSYPEVRRAAAKSLRAPVHQEYLQQHPDLEEVEGVKSKALEPEEVELLLPVLQSGSYYVAREVAAEQLGSVATSSPEIVRALLAACESDPHSDVRRAARRALRAPVHKEYLQKHPDVVEAERALQQVPAEGETGRGRTDPQAKGLIRCLKWSSAAGLAVGLVIGLGLADPKLSSSRDPGLWTVIIVALTAGAAVGAVVGAVVQGPKDRITGIIVGGILAAVVASLSWFPFLIWRLIEMGY